MKPLWVRRPGCEVPGCTACTMYEIHTEDPANEGPAGLYACSEMWEEHTGLKLEMGEVVKVRISVEVFDE